MGELLIATLAESISGWCPHLHFSGSWCNIATLIDPDSVNQAMLASRFVHVCGSDFTSSCNVNISVDGMDMIGNCSLFHWNSLSLSGLPFCLIFIATHSCSLWLRNKSRVDWLHRWMTRSLPYMKAINPWNQRLWLPQLFHPLLSFWLIPNMAVVSEF